MGGMALPGTILRRIFEMRNHPGDIAMLWRHLGEIGADAFLARARMATHATFLLEVAQAGQFLRSQTLPDRQVRRAGSGRAWQWPAASASRCGRQVSSADSWFLRRCHNRGGGQAGPGDGRENDKRDRKCSFPQTNHRPAVDEGNQEEREHRDSRQHNAPERLPKAP